MRPKYRSIMLLAHFRLRYMLVLGLALAVAGLILRAEPGAGQPSPVTPQALPISVQSTSRRQVTHTARQGQNITAHWTTINDPYTNLSPQALLLFTPRWNASLGDPKPANRFTTLWYNAVVGQWAIVNQDLAAMADGMTFSVLLINSSSAFVHYVIGVNLSRPYRSYLVHPLLNGQPDALVVIAPRKIDPNRYNTHPIGVVYDGVLGRWAVANEDLGTLAVNNAFNVYIATLVDGFSHTVSADNRAGDTTFLNHPGLNGNPEAALFITHNGNDGRQHAHVLAARYDSARQQWGIVNLDGAEMPLGTRFNIAYEDGYNRAFLPLIIRP